MQAQTGIPYILIDGRFENTPEALRLIGEVLGEAERGAALAREVEETFARIDGILAEVPEGERPRTYLARGPGGLETGMKGSINTEIIERAGGRNVADDGGATRGLVQASPEQLIVADPEVIVTWDRNFWDRVWGDPLWAGIEAVREGRVYLSPTAPFGWIDRPPSLNRMMGLGGWRGFSTPSGGTGTCGRRRGSSIGPGIMSSSRRSELDSLLEWAEGRPPG